jgi:hypothetical protein
MRNFDRIVHADDFAGRHDPTTGMAQTGQRVGQAHQ